LDVKTGDVHTTHYFYLIETNEEASRRLIPEQGQENVSSLKRAEVPCGLFQPFI